MNGIEVNIYLCNSNTIKELSNGAKEQINNFISPGRRNEMLQKQKLIQAQNFNKFEPENNLYNIKTRTIFSGKPRRLYNTRSQLNQKNNNSRKGSIQIKN